MAKKPACKICGTPHFGMAHIWKNDPPPPPKSEVVSPKNFKSEKPETSSEEDTARAGHRAYMRDYMRRWRASKKEGG
jgi:hypothetical protein